MIQLFNSPQFGEIRTAGTPDKPLFCAVDIARALGYSNPAKAVIDHCKGVTVLETPTKGGLQQVKYISEPDMYRLIFKSSAPNAEQFNSWVSEEVLPQIRKTGGYIPARAEDTPEEIMAKAVLVAQKTIEEQKQRLQMLQGENEALQAENKMLAPKAEYTDRVLQSTSTLTFTEAAKELNFRSVGAFLQRMMKDNILYKQSGRYLPYAKYSGKGYFATRTHHFCRADGRPDSSVITVVTEKGRWFLHEHFGIELPAVEIDIDFATS